MLANSFQHSLKILIGIYRTSKIGSKKALFIWMYLYVTDTNQVYRLRFTKFIIIESYFIYINNIIKKKLCHLKYSLHRQHFIILYLIWNMYYLNW